MKKNYLRRLLLLFSFNLLITINSNAQSEGDMAFIAFNADGDDDFAIVMLTDIPSNSTYYITDNESDGLGGITSGEGTLKWETGNTKIHAGTVVVFTDVDNGSNPFFGVSIGELSETGSFNISHSSKDGLLIFTGINETTPSKFIAGLQIGNDASLMGPFDIDGVTLTQTGLIIGSSIIVIDSSASPDGAVYNDSRNTQLIYSDYYSLLADASNWTNIVNGDGEILLPFSVESFTTHTTNWTGAINSTWNLNENWDNGVPSSNSTVTISDVAISPIINQESEIIVGNLTVDSGETLTLNNSNSVTISGQLTVNGSLNINSGSSLIISGLSTGNITYNRNLATSNWYLISSPVIGQDIDDFVAAEPLQENLPNIALGTAYNTVDDTWSYYQNGTSNSNTFTNGAGYSINLDSPTDDISFTGTVNTTDKTISLTTTGNGFNLLGNPYPSYINSADMLTKSSSSLLTETIWIWDQSENSGIGGYVTKVTADNFQLAPTQGFFVQSNGTTGDISINESFQSHQPTDTFSRTATMPEISLTISDGTNTRETKIYCIEGTTTGFDNGYDGPMFGGVPNYFAIYTHTITNGTGRNLAIQSIPNDFENLVIPVGVNAFSGTEITISANSINLSSNFHLYIEDKFNNTITSLDDNSDTTTTLTSSLNGIGRFYLHITSTSLNIDYFNLKDISIYTSEKNNLRIVGVENSNTKVHVYSILGKHVLTSSFKGNSVNDIPLPNITSGIYIIQLETEIGILNRKLVIE